MIYLNYGDNEVVAQLSSLSQNLVNPYYVWKLTDKDSDRIYIFQATDYSLHPHIWNRFTVSVATYSGPTAGVIDIVPSVYKYDVYEMLNQYDLNLGNARGLVESGLLTYNATVSVVASFTQSNDDVTTVYRNQNRV